MARRGFLYGGSYPDIVGSEPEYFCTCDECGEDICVGSTYYAFSGKRICEPCVESSRTTAETRLPYDGYAEFDDGDE